MCVWLSASPRRSILDVYGNKFMQRKLLYSYCDVGHISSSTDVRKYRFFHNWVFGHCFLWRLHFLDLCSYKVYKSLISVMIDNTKLQLIYMCTLITDGSNTILYRYNDDHNYRVCSIFHFWLCYFANHKFVSFGVVLTRSWLYTNIVRVPCWDFLNLCYDCGSSSNSEIW